MGFDQIYLHNVGRNQTEWIEVFGREVLPKLTVVTEAHADRPATCEFGAQLWPQASDWPGFRDGAIAAENGRLGRRLDVGPPAGDLRARGSSRSSRAGPPLRAWPAVTSRIRLGLMVGANTFRQPGPDRQARHDARPHQRRPGGARASAAPGSSGSTTRSASTSAPGSASASTGSTKRSADPAPPARRRAVQLTRARSTRCTTRSASRGRSRPTCRSSSAAPGRRRRSARWPCWGDAWNTSGSLEEVVEAPRHPRRALRRGRAATRRDRADDQLPDHHPGDRGGGPAADRGALRAQRDHRDQGRPEPGRPARGDRRRAPPVHRPRLPAHHRPDAGAVRPRDDRPPAGAPGGPGGRPGQGLTRCGSSRWRAASAERSSHPACRPPSATS